MAKKPARSPMMSSENPLSGSPWWVKAGLTFGLPAVGLGVLMYWNRQDAVADRADIKQQITEIRSSLTGHVRDGGALIQIAQRICINTAKTDQARLECVTIHQDKTP
jgi:hypothetical protein